MTSIRASLDRNASPAILSVVGKRFLSIMTGKPNSHYLGSTTMLSVTLAIKETCIRTSSRWTVTHVTKRMISTKGVLDPSAKLAITKRAGKRLFSTMTKKPNIRYLENTMKRNV
jgi:hypothetical protein